MHPATPAADATLFAFGPGGASLSFDGGGSFAHSQLDGIADAGTVKATGFTANGDFYAFSRGSDGLAHLYRASGPGSDDPGDSLFDPGEIPVTPPTDGLDEFATMVAGFFLEDLIDSLGAVPTRAFIDEVTQAMHDASLDQAERGGAPEGSAMQFAEDYLDRLETAGGGGIPEDFVPRAADALSNVYDERTGRTE